MHTWTDAPSQTSRGACEWVSRHKKCVDEVSLHFQLEMKTLGFLSAPADEYLKGRGQQALLPTAQSKCLRTYTDMNWCGEHFGICLSNCDTPCANKSYK